MKRTLVFLGTVFALAMVFSSPAARADEACNVSAATGSFIADTASDTDELSADTLEAMGANAAADHHCYRRCERDYQYCMSGCGHGSHHCKEQCRWRYDRCIHHCH